MCNNFGTFELWDAGRFFINSPLGWMEEHGIVQATNGVFELGCAGDGCFNSRRKVTITRFIIASNLYDRKFNWASPNPEKLPRIIREGSIRSRKPIIDNCEFMLFYFQKHGHFPKTKPKSDIVKLSCKVKV